MRYFNSHPHEEDDVFTDRWWPPVTNISTHILTKRMTCRLERCTKINGYFNSHPHEEDDDRLIPVCYLRDISTHILTKRMTIYSDTPLGLAIISTHILTKRMTHWILEYLFGVTISTHILTKRMTTLEAYLQGEEVYFNSHPHEEDDNIKQK